MRRLGFGVAIGGALLAAACGKAGDGNPRASGGESSTATASAGGDWKATDACAALPKDKVAAAAGAAVASAELSGQVDGGGTTMSASTCSYTMADGSTVGVTTTQFPDLESAEGARTGIAEGGSGIPKSEPVAGLGRAAYWNAGLKTLYVFYEGPRYVAFSVVNPKDGRDPKSVMTSIAKAFG